MTGERAEINVSWMIALGVVGAGLGAALAFGARAIGTS